MTAPDWREVDAMEPAEFEEFVLMLFRDYGWMVRRTPASGDGGADVVVERGGRVVFLAQCKHTQNPSRRIGVGAVDDLRRARMRYRAPDAVLIAATNAAGFAVAAQNAAAAHGVKLICRENWAEEWEILLK